MTFDEIVRKAKQALDSEMSVEPEQIAAYCNEALSQYPNLLLTEELAKRIAAKLLEERFSK